MLFLSFELKNGGPGRLASVIVDPFRFERVFVDEGISHLVHVRIVVGFQVGRAVELKGNLVALALCLGLHAGLVAQRAIVRQHELVAVGTNDRDHFVRRIGKERFDDGAGRRGHFILDLEILLGVSG